jgi:hypothetical protein
MSAKGSHLRLATWNCCRGTFDSKVPALRPLNFDVAVVQECAKPDATSDQRLWFGDNPKQGLAVLASNGFRLRAASMPSDVPKFVVPVEVTGAADFLLLAVWAKKNRPFPYVEGVVRAVRTFRDRIAGQPTVLMGDLNSNAIWDAEHPQDANHSALVRELEGLGLESVYHAFHGESHGAESRHTYFQWRRQSLPYHIDYCFAPQDWISRVVDVQVGAFEDWKELSDHRPLMAEFATEAPGSAAEASPPDS